VTPLTGRDLDVLDWVSEQYGVRLDQLQLLLGCRERWTQQWARRMADRGLVRLARILGDQPAWMWLSRVGQRHARTDFSTWTPNPGLLAHVEAVNAVRLHVHARTPRALWTCERLLARDARQAEHVPDAVVVTDDQRHAIEVELTVKSRSRTEAILDELSDNHDAVVYFCRPHVRASLERLGGTQRWPRLVTRPLPTLDSLRQAA
jgi:hypothetical protein